MRKIIVLLAAVLGLGLALAPAAVAAAPYQLPANPPAAQGTLGGVPTFCPPGSVLTVTGTGYAHGVQVNIGMYYQTSYQQKHVQIGTGVTNSDGAFTIVTRPLPAEGYQPFPVQIVSAGAAPGGAPRYLAASCYLL